MWTRLGSVDVVLVVTAGLVSACSSGPRSAAEPAASAFIAVAAPGASGAYPAWGGVPPPQEGLREPPEPMPELGEGGAAAVEDAGGVEL